MKAEPDAQLRLLDLQALDSRLDQLMHRRRTLPEHARLAALALELDLAKSGLITAQTELSDLRSGQTKADLDVEQVRNRARRDQDRLDSGGVGNARDLENLQKELVSLGRRQAELEDVELEIMERVEEVDRAASTAESQVTALTGQAGELEATRDDQLHDIDAQAEEIRAERDQTAVSIPAELVALYDKLRADHSGVGAAALHRGQCQGCQLALTPIDRARLRDAPPDEVCRCEECRRILVRRPDSGL